MGSFVSHTSGALSHRSPTTRPGAWRGDGEALLTSSRWLREAQHAAVEWSESRPLVRGHSPAKVEEVMPLAQVTTLVRESTRLMEVTAAGSPSAFMRYLHDLRRYPILSHQDEQRLSRLSQAGNADARDTLVRHNLRFVIMLAKKYSTTTVLFEDLVQEGNLGLMRAVSRFDPDRGVKLVSYAAYWIEQAIRTALINQQRTVRIPANRAAELSKVRQAMEAIRQQRNASPTADTVASMTGLSLSTVQLLMEVGGEVQLDGPTIGAEEAGSALLERLPSEHLADDDLDASGRAEVLSQVMSTLKPRDATIIRMCFGINYPREYTLEEIGQQIGVSRERVRQIRDRALLLMQRAPDRLLLADYWDIRQQSLSNDTEWKPAR